MLARRPASAARGAWDAVRGAGGLGRSPAVGRPCLAHARGGGSGVGEADEEAEGGENLQALSPGLRARLCARAGCGTRSYGLLRSGVAFRSGLRFARRLRRSF